MFSSAELLCSQASELHSFFMSASALQTFQQNHCLTILPIFPCTNNSKSETDCPDYMPHHSLLDTRTYYLAFNDSTLKYSIAPLSFSKTL